MIKMLVMFFTVLSFVFIVGCQNTEVKPDFFKAQKVNVESGKTQVAYFENGKFYLRVFGDSNSVLKEVQFKNLKELEQLIPTVEKETGRVYSEGDVKIMYDFVNQNAK